MKLAQLGSQLWCHAVMSLQFTRVRSFACIGRLQNLPPDCSPFGLYCVTITWQQIFKDLLHVMVVGTGASVVIAGVFP